MGLFLHFTDQNAKRLPDCLTHIDPCVVGITSVTAVAAARIVVGSGELWCLDLGERADICCPHTLQLCDPV